MLERQMKTPLSPNNQAKLFYFSLFKRKSVYLACVLAGLTLICSPYISLAQRAVQDNLRPSVMERLDEAEADRLLTLFKAQRLEENFCFKFQLEHKPRRGRTVRYEGIMYGSWNDQGPISRFKVFPDKVGEESSIVLSPVEIIVQNGLSQKAWIRRQNSEAFVLIEDSMLFEPILDGVLYTPFDLQMPFVFWNDYKYEGPSRVLSRIGQKFLMFPPSDSLAERDGITGVRVSVDDTYYALLRAEVLRGDNQACSQFTIRGIKKIQDQYIVKEVEMKNLLTKDATTFKVKAASIGLSFDDTIFNPESAARLPQIPATSFEAL